MPKISDYLHLFEDTCNVYVVQHGDGGGGLHIWKKIQPSLPSCVHSQTRRSCWC